MLLKLPVGLEELSLISVTDLDGQVISMDAFLGSFGLLDKLSVLTLENHILVMLR